MFHVIIVTVLGTAKSNIIIFVIKNNKNSNIHVFVTITVTILKTKLFPFYLIDEEKIRWSAKFINAIVSIYNHSLHQTPKQIDNIYSQAPDVNEL